MDALVLFLVCLVLTIFSALLTTYIAQSRPFWRWFLIGMLLPYLSIFIAMIVMYREQKAEERAAGSEG